MSKGPTRIMRAPVLRWLNIKELHIRPSAQRKLQPKWVENHRETFDADEIGHPVVNQAVDGRFYVMDGQHRLELLRAVGWGDQQVQCEVYEGLSLAEEAAKFLKLNDRINVKTFTKFTVRRTSGDPIAVGVDKVVMDCGLRLEEHRKDGCIRAVASLERVYRGAGLGPAAEHDGPEALRRTLCVLQGAWGNSHASFDGSLVEGLGLVQLRYNGGLDQTLLPQKLSTISGGAAGVISKAKTLGEFHSGSMARCIGGVIVELYNRGKKTRKLENWWT